MYPGDGPTGAYAVGAVTRAANAPSPTCAAAAPPPPPFQDVLDSPAADAKVLVLSGITAALSGSCAEAVRHAARSATGHVVYDPTYRPGSPARTRRPRC